MFILCGHNYHQEVSFELSWGKLIFLLNVCLKCIVFNSHVHALCTIWPCCATARFSFWAGNRRFPACFFERNRWLLSKEKLRTVGQYHGRTLMKHRSKFADKLSCLGQSFSVQIITQVMNFITFPILCQTLTDSVTKTIYVHAHRDIDLGQILYFIIVFCLYKMYKNKLSGVNTRLYS